MHIIRGHLVRSLKKDLTIIQSDLNVIKKAIITNHDYIDIFDQYKNNENAFLFLDPPYIFSNNKTYSCQKENEGIIDNTDMLYIIYEYMISCKCKVMLIINSLKIVKYIFKNLVKCEYTRMYQLSKKNSVHLIVTNYDI